MKELIQLPFHIPIDRIQRMKETFVISTCRFCSYYPLIIFSINMTNLQVSEEQLTWRVHFLGYFEGVGVGQVCVARSDGQDQAALLGDEL